jgi:signal transduction histidine kinase
MLKKVVGTGKPQTARRGIDAIEAESERLERLVESLLVLTRGDDGAPFDVGLHDLAEVAAEGRHHRESRRREQGPHRVHEAAR